MRMRRSTFLVIAVTLLLLAGCGRQDLYELPDSPYPLLSRLAFPAANEGVDVLGDYAFLAGGEAGLHVVDISDPAEPVLVTTINTTKYAEAIKVVRTFPNRTLTDIALLVEGTEGTTAYDITDPAGAANLVSGSTAINGNGLFLEQPVDPDEPFLLYQAEGWKGVRVLRSIPDFPGQLDYLGDFAGTLGEANAVSVKDGYAYVADNEMGITVLEIYRMIEEDLPPGQDLVVGWADTPGTALGIDVEGDYAYIADGVMGIAIFEIDGATDPVLVGSLDLPAYSRAIEVRDGLAFIAAATGGLHIIDVSDPSNPTYAGNVPSSYASDIALTEDGLVLISDYDEGLLICDGAAFADRLVPAAPASLSGGPHNFTTYALQWFAPGDDGFIGRAEGYELRYADEAILDETDWSAATPATIDLAPGMPTEAESFLLEGFSPGETRHFALRAADETGALSPLSDSVELSTYDGTVLKNGRVSPEIDVVNRPFVFEVTYLNVNSLEPAERHHVVIDGEDFEMDFVSGDYYTGALYRFTAYPQEGQHEYWFDFSAGAGNEADTDPAEGPFVNLPIVFTMGSPLGERGRDADEMQHTVSIADTVIFSPTEVTQADWAAAGLTGNFDYVGDDLPVHNVDWYEAVEYCNLLSDMDGLTPAYAIDGYQVDWDREADGWRLPTEAEWEWLCRAGTETATVGGELSVTGCGMDGSLDPYGWYCGNASYELQPVGQKMPNALGLYDMHGNVREWCWDWYGEYETGPVLYPTGPESGFQKVVRGGSWFYLAKECRSANREAFWPDNGDNTVGLRVVRTRFSR